VDTAPKDDHTVTKLFGGSKSGTHAVSSRTDIDIWCLKAEAFVLMLMTSAMPFHIFVVV
jgi:hypothetical protein